MDKKKKRYIGALGTVNSPDIGALDTKCHSIKTGCCCVCAKQSSLLRRTETRLEIMGDGAEVRVVAGASNPSVRTAENSKD